jgi:hypothetical protein
MVRLSHEANPGRELNFRSSVPVDYQTPKVQKFEHSLGDISQVHEYEVFEVQWCLLISCCFAQTRIYITVLYAQTMACCLTPTHYA